MACAASSSAPSAGPWRARSRLGSAPVATLPSLALRPPPGLGYGPAQPRPHRPAAPRGALPRRSWRWPPRHWPGPPSRRRFAGRRAAAASRPPARRAAGPDSGHLYARRCAAMARWCIVDQHAAHERLTEERLRAEFAGRAHRRPAVAGAGGGGFHARPKPRGCSAEAETLARLGLEIEAFGPGAILVRSVPAALKEPGCRRPAARSGGGIRRIRRAAGFGSAAGCGLGATGLPPLHPRRAAAAARGDGGAAARDGSHAARRHLQPWPADVSETYPRRAGENVRPPRVRSE